MGKPCSVDNCLDRYYAKGFCEKHYQRDKKYGSPEDRKGNHVPLENKFFRSVQKTDSCWLWTGFAVKGYGRVWVDGKNMRSNRASWVIHNGPIPDGIFVLHKCDNPSCVNPEHLYLGDHNQNMRDKVERDRCAHPDRKGEKSGRVKLKEADVIAIRSDSRKQAELAIIYGYLRH